ncbi:MAG TPA: HAD family hydrolase [Longimicrobiales bacterium]
MKHRLSAVLFDLDGTLVSTRRLYLEAYRRALEAQLQRLPTVEEVIALRPRAELRFLRDLVPAEVYDACLRDFRRFYAELHESHFGGVYDGVEEMLRGLRSSGRRIGLVTGKSRASWEVMLGKVELGPFDVTVFDDDVREPKPDPEGLRLAVDALGIEPAAAAYVGDALSDVEAAAAAGMLPVAALWPKKPEELESFEARARAAGAVTAASPADVVRLAG